MLGSRNCVSFFYYFDVVANLAHLDESICLCTWGSMYEFPSRNLDKFSVDYPIVYQKTKKQKSMPPAKPHNSTIHHYSF